MTPEQMMALLVVIADLRLQVSTLAAELEAARSGIQVVQD